MWAVSNYSLSIRFIVDHALNVKHSGQEATVESQGFLFIHRRYLMNGKLRSLSSPKTCRKDERQQQRVLWLHKDEHLYSCLIPHTNSIAMAVSFVLHMGTVFATLLIWKKMEIIQKRKSPTDSSQGLWFLHFQQSVLQLVFVFLLSETTPKTCLQLPGNIITAQDASQPMEPCHLSTWVPSECQRARMLTFISAGCQEEKQGVVLNDCPAWLGPLTV